MCQLLITGSTGFIGNSLLNSLTPEKWQIIATTRTDVKYKSLDSRYINVGEFNQSTKWTDLLAEVDVVIHLAARAHILNDRAVDPVTEFYNVNVAGTANLVKQCIAAGVRHFIFMSSVGAMATSSNTPLTEDAPCHPTTPYGHSKLQAEQVIKNLCADSSMTYTLLRAPLVYGSRNPGNMARLLKLIKTGLPLPFGAIKNQRSLVYVGNLIDALITCITHPNARNQTFLVSDGSDFSTPDLIRQIGYAMGKKPLLLPISPRILTSFAKPLGKQETINRLTDSLPVSNQKIRDCLNWTPPFTAKQGLQDTVDWYLSQ